jgi:hypothetical protein
MSQHVNARHGSLAQELALPPDREVVQLADELRAAASLASTPDYRVPPMTPRAPAEPRGASTNGTCTAGLMHMTGTIDVSPDAGTPIAVVAVLDPHRLDGHGIIRFLSMTARR